MTHTSKSAVLEYGAMYFGARVRTFRMRPSPSLYPK